jgi:hypothetical protein
MKEIRNFKFFIGKTDCDGFVALTTSEPFICIERKTKKEAVDAALKAWEFYFTATGKKDGLKPRVTKEKAIPASKERHFTPTNLIYAEG